MRARYAIFGVAAIALLAWWLTRAGPERRANRSVTTTASTTQAVPTTSSTTLQPHPPVISDPVEADKGAEEVASYRRDIADPTRSDLPAGLFDELTQLGVRVQRAYLTSAGRDQFPSYFGRDPVSPLYTDVEIETAGARSRNGRTDAVDVTVVWSGRPVNGDPAVAHHQTIVVLVNSDGRWRPQAQFG